MVRPKESRIKLPPGAQIPLVGQAKEIEISATRQESSTQFPVFTTLAHGNEVKIWSKGGATRIEGPAAAILAGFLARNDASCAWPCKDSDIVEACHAAVKIINISAELARAADKAQDEKELEAQASQGAGETPKEHPPLNPPSIHLPNGA